MTKRLKWTKDMEDVIREYYPLQDIDSIFELIPELSSIYQIYNRARKLGIESGIFWSDEEMKLLIENYPHYTNRYLQKYFFPNRAIHSIRTMALKNGLHKTDEKSVKWYDKEEMIRELRKLGQELNRTPLIRELVPNGLPSAKTFDRYFGLYTKACSLAGLTPNKTLFGNALTGVLSKDGSPCFSISELFITDFLYDNNIACEKEVLYSDITGIQEFGTLRCDWLLENGEIVEFFGMMGNKDYEDKVMRKLAYLYAFDIEIIEIYPEDVSIERLTEIFI